MVTIEQLNVDHEKRNSVFITFYLSKVHSHLQDLSTATYVTCLVDQVKYFAFTNSITLIEEKEGFQGLFAAQFMGFENFTLSIHDPLSGSPDVTTVQLILSSGYPAIQSWAEMRKLLLKLCDSWVNQIQNAPVADTSLIGANFIYLGNYQETVTCEQIVLDRSILQLAMPYEPTDDNFCLATNRTEYNALFLLNVPRKQTTVPSIVYVYLNHGASENNIAAQFFNNNNQQLTSDAYVLKANYEWQHMMSQIQPLEDILAELFKMTHRALVSITESAKLKLLNKSLKPIADRFHTILALNNEFKLLGITIHKQLKNLEIKNRHTLHLTGQTDFINQYHLNTICDQYDACAITLSKSEITMDQIQTATGILEAQQSKLSAHRSSSFQTYLAVLGVFLAGIQLFDNEAIRSILVDLKLKVMVNGIVNVDWYESIFAKVVLSGTFTLVIYLFSKIIYKPQT